MTSIYGIGVAVWHACMWSDTKVSGVIIDCPDILILLYGCITTSTVILHQIIMLQQWIPIRYQFMASYIYTYSCPAKYNCYSANSWVIQTN